MRFIGNKELLTIEIKNLLKKKELLNSDLSFFDAFCGTGAVADLVRFWSDLPATGNDSGGILGAEIAQTSHFGDIFLNFFMVSQLHWFLIGF